MPDYTPRPGSKTEAAVNYLSAHAGAAGAIDLAEAIDTERKNLPAQFKAAIDHGLIEPCDLPEGFGYRLRGADARGTPRETPAKKVPSSIAATSANAGQGTGDAIPKRGRGRPPLGHASAPKAPKKVQSLPAPPPASEDAGRYPIPEFLRAAAEGASQSAPVTAVASFRCGEYSDGSIRIEGLEPSMTLTHNAGEGPHACMLSPAAARTLIEFLHPAAHD
jgi:hypothetical protein